MTAKKNPRLLIRFGAGIVLILVALVGIGLYLNYSAEKNARQFCAEIPVGSDIAIAVAKAKDSGIRHWYEEWHTFYFPGSMFDVAVCEVSTDPQGRVKAKSARIERD